MPTVTLEWRSNICKVDASDIRNAFLQFDNDFRGKTTDSGTGYVIVWRNKRYPPKKILELATHIPVSQFSGGEMTNSVFQKLGFKAYKDGCLLDTERRRLDSPCPSLPKLLDKLFRQRWTHFKCEGNSTSLPDGRYPGVYVLAYTQNDLLGRRVREEDVFYVGVSHVGVHKRLSQFRAGLLLGGGHHSGAKRFFHEINYGKPYNEAEAGKKFFVAYISVPCRFRKLERKQIDLQKLGIIAGLEWYVLGRIKGKCGDEPELNKK